MVHSSQSGDLRNAGSSPDHGTFSVQASDVPLANLRRKCHKQKFQRKKVRLTPINENEEMPEREVIVSPDSGVVMTPVSITLTSPCGDDMGLHHERNFERSDTPMRKCNPYQLHLDLDSFEEELENIAEVETNNKDPDVSNILAELPPRPKCKRKVLPPSITATNENTIKRKKLLKLRSKLENKLENAKYSISSDLKNVMKKQTLSVLNEELRPKSAEHGVRVIRLADLSSKNSTSVPDLPSIISKLAKANELVEMSHRKTVTKTAMYDESGALSTPRDAADGKIEKCLRGSDLSSFYNMWDRDRKIRPFDKKESDKIRISTHRDCLCSIRNCAKKCFNQRSNVLPPISSSSPK